MSLDVFRGMTIAAMILVNNPGSWKAVYPPLRHAVWNGWTPTDLIFPFFLFIAGVSVVFSFAGRKARGESRKYLVLHVLWRGVVLIAIGILLNMLIHPAWNGLRFFGVLQRIGLVYIFAAPLTLTTKPRTRFLITAVLLLGYWLLMILVPVPGIGRNQLTPTGNLASFVDFHLFPGRLWRTTWDPEGLLSTLPAIASALLGTLVGDAFLDSARSRISSKRITQLVAAGLVAVVLGELWGFEFPINKNLWTSSYVLFTGGLAIMLFLACYWTIDVKGWTRWARAFVFLGTNPLAIYAASDIVAVKVLPSIKAFAYPRWFAPLGPPAAVSCLWAAGYVALWWIAGWIMYRKAIFIKL